MNFIRLSRPTSIFALVGILFLACAVTASRAQSSNSGKLRPPCAKDRVKNWARSKGLAASICLDRDDYQLGEDIPIHIEIANFDAPVRIYSEDPAWNPCSVVEIEVLDSAGRPLSWEDRVHTNVLCTGGGPGPQPFGRGSNYAFDWSLKSMDWLPARTGTYSVVLNWHATTGNHTQSQWNLRTYAILETRATFHVGDADPHPSP